MSTLNLVKAFLSFSFSARKRPTSLIKSRTTPIRSDGDRRSSESGMGVAIHSLNHIFALLTPPSARKFAPITEYCRLLADNAEESAASGPLSPPCYRRYDTGRKAQGRGVQRAQAGFRES